MKNILITLFIFLNTLTFAQQGQATTPAGVKEEKIELVIGIDKIFKLDFIPNTRPDIGTPSVVGIQFIPQKREVKLKGKTPGRSVVDIRTRSGDLKIRYIVNVTATEKSRIVQELNDKIGDVEGIEIGIKGGTVVVGGKIIVPGDIGRVVLVLDSYKDVLNLVEVSPQTYQLVAKKMQEGLRRVGLKDVTVRFFNNSYLIEGIVTPDQKNGNFVARVAEAYLPDRIESLARRVDAVQKVGRSEIIRDFTVANTKEPPPPAAKQIKITAQFVELSKEYNKVFGFKWQPTLGGDGGSIRIGKTSNGGVSTNSEGTLSGTISSLFPKLNSAKAAGYARVIQSGIVVTKDNVEANIKKTTVKNITLGSGEFSQATKIEAGMDLKVRPNILQEEKINLAVSLEVSSSVASDVFKNNIKTEVIVRSKESAVIGGISKNQSSTDYDKDPPGGTDTTEGGFPLFSFLRSKKITKSKEQFVVFITPQIIENVAAGTEEIKKKFRKRGL